MVTNKGALQLKNIHKIYRILQKFLAKCKYKQFLTKYKPNISHSPRYQSLIKLSNVHSCPFPSGGDVEQYSNHHKDDQKNIQHRIQSWIRFFKACSDYWAIVQNFVAPITLNSYLLENINCPSFLIFSVLTATPFETPYEIRPEISIAEVYCTMNLYHLIWFYLILSYLIFLSWSI